MSQEPLHTLIVEDDEDQRVLLTRILQGRGHEVVACGTSEEGLLAYQRNPFPLVILDMLLPGMNGVELCREMRLVPESTQTVILFATGVDGQEGLEEALLAGADDYITKPLTGDLLHVRLTIAERQVRALQRQKERELDLMRDALRDSLTDLPNRQLFFERLDRAARRHAREGGAFSVLYVDLDGFREINETHGRDWGDRVLREVGERLEPCVRPVDTVARMEEDEFIVLLDGVNNVSEPVRLAHRIHQALSAPFRFENQEVFSSASIGIALSQTGFERPSDMVRDAKTASRTARAEDGPSSHRIFDPVLHAGALARVHLESRLKVAVERDELVHHYQPIVSLETGEILGFEALVRWEDPDRGMLFPDEFVPIAEETGLIVPIGWWGLEEGCRQLKEWQDRFPRDVPLSMAINISARQFEQSDLVDQISTRITRFGIPPASLHIELTESSLMSNVDDSSAVLQQLWDRSLRLHIDDFGTGYSSLSYLCRLPIHTLKIDRTFVDRMGEAESDLEIVKTIVRLAKNLGLSIIAEGVETEEQLEQLIELGCEEAQGFLFSRAVENTVAEGLLAGGPLFERLKVGA
jgi:diguanylate cyclase (GGDEF)-like protein